MKLEDIMNEWEKDSKLDIIDLHLESLNTPTLHSKYLKIHSDENMRLKGLTYTFKEMERHKFEYYSGKMCQEDLEERGWDQFDHKLLKQDIPRYLDSDPDLNEILIKIDQQKEKVESVKSIITSINGRSFHISNAIKWQQFLNGIN